MRWPGRGCARSTHPEYVLPVGSLDQCFPNTGLTEVGDRFQWPTVKRMVKLNHAIVHLKKNVFFRGLSFRIYYEKFLIHRKC